LQPPSLLTAFIYNHFRLDPFSNVKGFAPPGNFKLKMSRFYLYRICIYAKIQPQYLGGQERPDHHIWWSVDLM
ncbi:MAG TPA: hypothetical protein VHO48_01220, partial [Anaerolineaceae bacterium]|nr:hypothetical protein [Anaerolineaceae bacterium]